MAGTTVNLQLKAINPFDPETTSHGASLMGRAISRPERTKSQEELAQIKKEEKISSALPEVEYSLNYESLSSHTYNQQRNFFIFHVCILSQRMHGGWFVLCQNKYL